METITFTTQETICQNLTVIQNLAVTSAAAVTWTYPWDNGLSRAITV